MIHGKIQGHMLRQAVFIILIILPFHKMVQTIRNVNTFVVTCWEIVQMNFITVFMRLFQRDMMERYGTVLVMKKEIRPHFT